MVKYFSVIFPYWPYPLIFYGTIRSPNNLSRGINSTSFEGKWTCFLFYLFLFMTSFAILI